MELVCFILFTHLHLPFLVFFKKKFFFFIGDVYKSENILSYVSVVEEGTKGIGLDLFTSDGV